ncbi:MAG TPA: serine--tRNA ligase [Patescibacteria group bacterium]|nr:serine--tRNA ligase [Patescibacteria group bacterium]
MLDIKYIRENADKVKDAVKRKFLTFDVDELLALDEQRRSLLSESEILRAQKNEASKAIPKLAADERAAKIAEMKTVDAKQAEIESKLVLVQTNFDELMLYVPNIPADDVPEGPDDTYNKSVKFWHPQKGEYIPSNPDDAPAVFDFEIKDHIALGEQLGLFDFERGVKTSGFRGYYLKNEAVLLHYGLLQYALKKLQAEDFAMMSTPTLVREFALIGSGHFPGDREGIYQVANAKDRTKDKEDVFLTGTSEPSLLAYFAETIIDESELPKKVCGISQCYRSEIGSYGKDTKGVYRIHEFMKVEQVVICKADIAESEMWHQKILGISESILQDLQLPYRIVANAAGDMGVGKYRMFDIETWMPGRGKYGETHSASNLTDWQTRRLGIKYKDAKGKNLYAFALNNTAIASPRILIAILENYQQADGSVRVPDVLRSYIGKDVLRPLTV